MKPSPRRINVAPKLLMIAGLTLLAVLSVETLLGLRNAQQQSENESIQRLTSLHNDYQGEVGLLGKSAASLSLSFASRPDVQQLFLEKDRDGLLKLLTPTFADLERYGIAHLFLEDANGMVFVRVHDPTQFGDSITYLRTAAALRASSNKQTVSGVEIGSNRLGIRSVSPLFRQNEMIGLVEVGLDYDEPFLANLKARKGADYKMWVTWAAAAEPKLSPPANAPPAPVPELFYYASTNPTALPIPTEAYNRVLHSGKTEYYSVSAGNQPLGVLIAPLVAYPDRIIGILEISIPRASTLAAQQRNQSVTLAVSALLAMLGFAVQGVLTHLIVLRPLGHLTSVARQQLAGDLAVQAKMRTGDEFEQLGNTLNELTAKLDTTLKEQEAIIIRRTAQLSASADVGRAVSSVLDLPELLRAVVNLIAERFGYYYVAVFMLDETSQYAVLREATGEAGRVLKESGHRLEVNASSMVGSAIIADDPRIAAHAETEKLRFANPLLPETLSEIALPLRLGGRVVGALDVQSTQPDAFDESVTSVLQSMADQIAVAMGNARLYTEIQQRARQQEGLARVATLAGSTLAVDELLDRLMLEARQLLGADITVVLLKDESRQALVGRHLAGEGAPVSAQEEWFIPLDAPGFQQSVFARGGSYYSDKGLDDPNVIPAYKPYMSTLGIRSFCGVALRAQEQSLGELYVANRSGGFGREDVALLQPIAGYMANAIQNARLFEETQHLAAREQLINTMTARIRASLTMEEVLRVTVQEIADRMGAARVAVRLRPAPGGGRQNEEGLA